MIEVKELTKIYKSRKSGTCTALDRIGFTLPDKGFVFVIGKSGSGKTTLLSLLGGLDTVTSGEILENGRHIEAFGLGEQVAYRNSTVGFIFQDFHLIDDLTVFENVALALELQGEEEKEKVKRALEDTDLSSFEARYPKELSGGQKQRVAIARALVKDPTVLLADEPTGNLDSKTTGQILDLLKELSEEKLVVIVSHNLSDAEHYADEILELSDGKILHHVRRNENFDARLHVENDILVIPAGERFTDENIGEIAAAIRGGHVKDVRQDVDRFLPQTAPLPAPKAPLPLEKKHLKFKHTAKLSERFARRSWIKTAVYGVVFAAILVVLGLSQLIMNFNGGEVVASEMAKRNLSCDSFIKDTNDTYDSLDASRLVNVEDNDLRKFYDAGYEGKAYPVINYSLQNTSSKVAVNQNRATPQKHPYGITETAGLVITEESFLEKKFGKLKFLALAEEQKEYGVYITDFFADAYISNHSSQYISYEKMLGKFNCSTGYVYGYVNGILDTEYKERYSAIFEKLTNAALSDEEYKQLVETDEGLAFYDEITQYLNMAYSFNPDFVKAVTDSGTRQFVSSAMSTFKDAEGTHEYSESWFSASDLKNTVPLQDNEILINYDVYNRIFGTNYTPQNLGTFSPREVELSYCLLCDQTKSQVKCTETLKIVGLNNNGVRINVADNVLKTLQRIEMFPFGYYFDSAAETELLFNAATENGYLPNSSIGSSITTMTKAVGVFSRFFVLIFAVLCAALLLLMVQFELKNIRERMREIGILKALGIRDLDLIAIFGFQVLVAGALTVLLYIAGSFVFIGLANRVLVLSLSELAKTTMVMNLSFLFVKGKYLLQNCLLAVLIFAASFLVPMLRLRYIKPTNVIKAKE